MSEAELVGIGFFVLVVGGFKFASWLYDRELSTPPKADIAPATDVDSKRVEGEPAFTAVADAEAWRLNEYQDQLRRSYFEV